MLDCRACFCQLDLDIYRMLNHFSSADKIVAATLLIDICGTLTQEIRDRNAENGKLKAPTTPRALGLCITSCTIQSGSTLRNYLFCLT